MTETTLIKTYTSDEPEKLPNLKQLMVLQRGRYREKNIPSMVHDHIENNLIEMVREGQLICQVWVGREVQFIKVT